jgi:hypothetical protein
VRVGLRRFLSLALLVSIALTGLTGYLQSALELRRFVPHKFFAYSTLMLAAVHVAVNFRRLLGPSKGGRRRTDGHCDQ